MFLIRKRSLFKRKSEGSHGSGAGGRGGGGRGGDGGGGGRFVASFKERKDEALFFVK